MFLCMEMKNYRLIEWTILTRPIFICIHIPHHDSAQTQLDIKKKGFGVHYGYYLSMTFGEIFPKLKLLKF